MIGAIAGDIIGSSYEWFRVKTTEFELFTDRSRFTDDTVLTVAVADCVLNKKEYAKTIKEYGCKYPDAGYGMMFGHWLKAKSSPPYNSYGNGSAMRVSPIGFVFDDAEKIMNEAKKSAEVTHNHSEGIKGAQAVAMAIFLAKNGETKKYIKDKIQSKFKYNLDQRLDDIRPTYAFDETCQGSVPQAIIAFLESDDYEDAVRKAVSLGGDSDTLGCITGGIAQAYYKTMPIYILKNVERILDPALLVVVNAFNAKYNL